MSNVVIDARRYGFYLVMSLLVCGFLVSHAEAGIPTSVQRGEPTTISWVVSGVADCQGGFVGLRYPDNSPTETIYDDWNGSTRAANGSQTFPQVLGDSSASFPQSYTFQCRHLASGVQDTAVLTVTDCDPGDVWNTTTHTCAAASAPSVNAGIDRGVTSPPTSSVDISGATASDPDGIKSTVWSFVSGPGTPTISSGTTRTPRFSGLTVAGTYTFRLTVFDTLDTKGEDDMIVWVVNPPPMASFTSGATCVIPAGMSSCTTPITFTSAYTDPAGVELTDCSGAVIWSAGSGAQTRTVSIPHSGSCYQIHKAPGGVKLSTDLIGIASCDPDALQHRVVADATVQRVTATDGRHVLASAGTQADM